ncbi:sodium/hydrogen antiporter, putative [Talaromyces stipitatus ATCC 10500]|uniref:Sodium/hydrogen antiporter, putative n=1 Tax=Talaromyces stipitatus (strain ATCC 10500 / CBS 375.48 / QM 6759 / NRRL 1006) TaxID=441959 RepID=B8LYC0_TALSN|nr:sodium/hydrogen antiporter, putative [Talaromyces stipitatus ATCC 10500]EED22849.1 sodium/hydrogen antiporter, putative [Talaromyces stipitatus ATCC 10500]
MAWDQLSVDKPHWAYIILGGFTSLFMLCSLFVKEKLYIGEATVATLCGIIFGPYAANLFSPDTWGNVDKITLECSRIVLVVQCFAVGVELPKSYMERHWRSVFFLLVPVMTYGWLITSLFIWWLIPPLSWLESLACAACVTATDPVLASSVVGKGKFAKRVPKHLRDVLSAESGCNDGMAFPFIYLSLSIIKYRHVPHEVALHWICNTILYECVAGAVYGFLVGYIARHMIKFAEKKNLIDRESFLVFYFVLALFCAGSGSTLGMDDLLIGFAAGVGFSNDGWFTAKTEESHVSNVIDLLLNLAYFVYFGSIIPWSSYNMPDLGMVPWRLVVIAILVIFFRRIPIMMALKPIIPDIKTWREALFAGHFGPIGVGAIFAAILARAELEHDSTEPQALADMPRPGEENYLIVQLIWPITTFLVIASIIVHGSSIAVFTLGKRINTLTITLSYTTANDEGPSWMNRLPRVQSMSRSSLSLRKADSEGSNEQEYPPGMLPPIGVPGNFLRRVKEGEDEGRRPQSLRPKRRRKRMTNAGGPISQSAIMPARRPDVTSPTDEKPTAPEEPSPVSEEERAERDRIEREGSPPRAERDRYGREPEIEVYQEGNHLIVEDEEGNVLRTEDITHESPEEQRQHILEQHKKLQADKSGEFAKSKSHPHEKTEGEEIQKEVEQTAFHPGRSFRHLFGNWGGWGGKEPSTEAGPSTTKPAKPPRQSAHAYQFGDTIIVEDEDGEVIKKYTIPSAGKSADVPAAQATESQVRRGLTRMGTWVGKREGESSKASQKTGRRDDLDLDDGLRFTVAHDPALESKGVGVKGRRMSKQDFIKEISKLDPKARRNLVEKSDAPPAVKQVARHEAAVQDTVEEKAKEDSQTYPTTMLGDPVSEEESGESDSESESVRDIPTHDVAGALAQFSGNAQERRRRLAGEDEPVSASHEEENDSEDDGTERIPPSVRKAASGITGRSAPSQYDTGETPAERKRRLAALGEIDDSDDENDDEEAELSGVPRRPRPAVVRVPIVNEEDAEDEEVEETRPAPSSIQFADGTRPSRGTSGISENGNGNGNGSSRNPYSHGNRHRISWGGERGRH